MDPQNTNPGNVSPQETAPQTEMSTPQSIAPSVSEATPQQAVTEGKKGKSWIIILIIILSLLLALGGAIWWTGSKIGGAFSKFADEFTGGSSSGDSSASSSGSGSETITPTKDNPIIAANNKMRNELGSFDYVATITSNAMDMNIDTTMNCTFDGKNKLEYCNTEMFMGLEQETYFDWANGYEYIKTVSPYVFTQTDESWTKTKISQGTSGALDISNGTSFNNLKSEAVDGGTKYTGKIGGFTAAAEGATTVSSADMDFEIIVNNDGYIDIITMSLEGTNMSQDIVIKYSNFGTAASLSIPEEALNAG